ncbi:MAG: hypothetical protein PHH54_04480 [Candidatus Nanoarchaeia archaeon]|nr:hypothetical protein [Candidatus Nanoarchaeia archaeon]MDD5741216.1 hypothetical protein [Candidatus Nanoarchaeia archaeon]
MPVKTNAENIELNEKEKWELDKLLTEYEGKIKRQLKDEVDIIVNIKSHQKGKSRKFSISVNVVGGVKFGAIADDYDLARATHEVFNKILSEIEHRLHVSSNRNKRR